MVVLAAFTTLGGLVALLAGAYGLQRTRRITEAGEVTEALVKAVWQGADRPTLQFETADGRVLEVVSPVPASRRRPLPAGERVRIAYDTDDPREIVLIGSERRGLDRSFAAAGACLVVVGLALAMTA
ncbi:DUF3592 domain-containing protein [Streptomyces aurantiacus]|uniref:DUF3592 domain-containing protein n=1 Tax=Streptomyces aurantiacus JA 4570 TaxID=1286094 RepID=S3ZKD6_9ACTN|nr:DUF3592 domain-containing protein [Streptomyces aurantiacus]EPH43234.1 hypothetical protein STRAU_3693 [Streptomyces aurantiacus JA 4570]